MPKKIFLASAKSQPKLLLSTYNKEFIWWKPHTLKKCMIIYIISLYFIVFEISVEEFFFFKDEYISNDFLKENNNNNKIFVKQFNHFFK